MLDRQIPLPPHRADSSSSGEPIAIIGSAARYPGACASVGEFWAVLRAGRCVVGEVPADRWSEAFYHPDGATLPGRTASRWGGFLEAPFPRGFDAAFFDLASREAAALDPQQRLLLEVSWRALEDAGLASAPDRGLPVGVFVAISTADHHGAHLGRPEAVDGFTATGASFAAAAGRLSYVFGFDGPAMAIDTACSSSLVALHQAALALRAGDCEAAVVAGVNALLTPNLYICLSKMGLLSPDGRCKAFDAGGNGYVRAEGCGAVVLKCLSVAQAAGDRVLAVLRGSAVNQDGRSNGLTAPSRPAQERVIRRALANAGLEPAAIDYVEAHGTGTPLGDGIELQALAATYGVARDRPLLVGSVKTNIGHLEAGAGLAGLIKTVEALQRGEIPAHLHLETPTPQLDWAGTCLHVPTALTPWPATGQPRRAAVSSFGFSGTNAHIILEQAPERPPGRRQPEAVLLPLSARSPEARHRMAAELADWLEAAPRALADVGLTLGAGRTGFPHRLAVVGGSAEELAARLRGRPAPAAEPGLRRHLAELGALWLAGEALDWARLYRPYGAVRCALPGHPMAPRDHWAEALPAPPPAVPPAPAPPAEPAALRRLIDGHVRELLGGCPAPLDPECALVEQGVTSLMALELRRALEASLGRPVPPSLFYNYPSIARLAEFFAAGPPAASRPEAACGLDRLDELSPADLAHLIERELDTL